MELKSERGPWRRPNRSRHTKIYKRKNTNNKDLVADEEELSEALDRSIDTTRINHHHVVENRRRQYQ
eukprot:3469673-Heterocapsa_arctica.AAC.1